MTVTERIKITDAIIAQIRGEIERTNTSPLILFKNADVPPPFGMGSTNVHNWIDGKTKRTRKAILDYVLNQYAKLPDSPPTIPITKAMHEKLLREDRRTGIGGVGILKVAKGTKPQGLSHDLVGSWKRGVTATARADHWVYVMEAYKAAPDAAAHNSRIKRTSERLPIPKPMKNDLEEWRKAGLLSAKAFKTFKNVPDGLNWSMIANWLSGISNTAAPDYLEFVSDTCRAMLREESTRVPVTRTMRRELRTAWKNCPRGEKPSLSAIVEIFLHDTSATTHPKAWLDLIDDLQRASKGI